MEKRTLRLYFLSIFFILLSAAVDAQTGSGSSTLDNGYRGTANTDSTFEYAETLYIGPNAVWQIDGVHMVYSRFIWIAPGAQINGNGKLVIANPDDNPFYVDMTGFTTIDGNNGNFIEPDIIHANPNNIRLKNIADPGFGTVNPPGPLSAALKVGKHFDFSVNGGDVILSGNDLVFGEQATVSHYAANRMVVTGNTVSGHIVKINTSFRVFEFPVGIAEGDYTPATVAGAGNYHVAVTDYSASPAVILVPAEGMDRSWHIYGAPASFVTLQHNSPLTDGSLYADPSAFITQYLGSALWSTTNTTDYISTGLHTQPGIPVPVAETAQSAWFTKTSDRVTPLSCSPAIACSSDITVNAGPGSCTAVVTWPAPVVSDTCTGVTITSTHLSGDTFPVGVTRVVYTVSDLSGYTDTCSFTVSVSDTEAPVITCAADITVSAAPGTCGYMVSGHVSDPTVNDACGTVTLTHNYTPGPFAHTLAGANFPVGVTTVLWTATDSSGNTATCPVTVTVNDTEAPVFVNCIGLDTLTLALFPGVCEGGSVWPIPFATDNCSGVTLTQPIGPAMGSILPVGDYPIAYVATDAAGNTDTCAFVFRIIDTKIPTIVCPANLLQVENTPGLCGWVSPAASLSPLLAQSNCPGNVTWSVTNPDATVNTGTQDVSGYTFAVGTSTVTYTLTETAGAQTASCSFRVIVRDSEAPVFTGCPLDVTVSNTAGTCGAVVTWTIPVSTDNCPGVTVTSSHTPGTTFPTGVTTVLYTATDAAGNTATCSFDVTVEDTGFPVIVCPADISVAATTGSCGAIVTWTPPVASDNCGVTVTSTHVPGDTFPTGVTVVTYTAVDPAGHTVSCSFNVTVTGTDAPLISNCPGDITAVPAYNSCVSQVYWPTVLATDPCGNGTVTVTTSHPSGYLFPVGSTPVLITATGPGGNFTTCTFNVTVLDNQAPVFLSCVSDKVAGNVPGTCAAPVFWDSPGAFDNCPGVTYTSTHLSGDVFPVGITTVTLTATDASGNTADCTFTVTVNDTQAPVITGIPADLTVQTTTGQCSATVTWAAPTATDNCQLQSFTSTQAGNTLFPPGVTTVTYTATDASGNVSTDSFTVTVIDAEAPTVSNCPTDITVAAATGNCSGTATWTAPVFTDNCASTLTVTSSHNPGDSFPAGTTTVTYTATDPSGNSVTCSFEVSINDNELPTVVNCPADITRCSEYITWVPPVFTDNCTHNLSVVSNYTPGANFPVGTTTVIYTATDAAGNVATCSFDINRSGIRLTPVTTWGGCDAKPTATATVIVNDAIPPFTFDWGPHGTDSLIGNLPPGIYSVTVTDFAGCSASASMAIGQYMPVDILASSVKEVTCGYADGNITTVTTGGTEPYTYLWNNGTTAADLHNLTEGTYRVTVTDANGCTDSLSVLLDCEFTNIPQLVTPNGDKHNDAWEVPGLQNIKEAVVEIYNRWGNLVYKASPYLNDWAGYSERTTDVGNGKLPAGTYFYVIRLKPNEKAISGYLELQY